MPGQPRPDYFTFLQYGSRLFNDPKAPPPKAGVAPAEWSKCRFALSSTLACTTFDSVKGQDSGEFECSENAAKKVGTMPTTQWNVVLEAGRRNSPESSAAMAKLCETYWYPLYTFIRRSGHGPEDAEDLTQEFFARLMQKNCLEVADPEKGRFRSFLLMSLKHFMANEWDKALRLKRGGGQKILSLDEQDAESRYRLEPADPMTPERLFNRRWALTVLERAIERLGQDWSASGKALQFQHLKGFLEDETKPAEYTEIAHALAMSPNAVAVAVHRLRQAYREAVRAEITQTVIHPNEASQEMRELFEALN